ncbi:hypothetical protein EV702DRAFT_1147260 [Suillus placidus]|uniref:Uncharacterized protein n=1 Tax=Suillus placidus TaxID=48579 RepID=A0A9P7CX62_9AGAM|nr:hypothetical protein EV702DRAFT_1147260 [Suillus placidus]
MLDSVLALNWLCLFSTQRRSTLGTKHGGFSASWTFLRGTPHGTLFATQHRVSSQFLGRQLHAAACELNPLH